MFQLFLAVQDSSIGDLVSHSLTHYVTFDFSVFCRAVVDLSDNWLEVWGDNSQYNDYNDYKDYNDYNDYDDYNDFNDHNDYNDENNFNDYNDYNDHKRLQWLH